MSIGNILIVEDDADIREGVRILLESENYCVSEAENGHQGLQLLDETTDLVILDIMMPGISGLRTCEEIRKKSNVPVLFLTAKAQESDKLIGLMAGGDDYLPKPFSYAELLGRVKALVRRYNVYQGKTGVNLEEKNAWLELRGIRIHRTYNEVFVDGKEKEMSDIEYHILLLLMRHPGRIFSAQNLYESVWEEPYFYSCSSTVMVHIRKLRVKIEADPKNPRYIKTVWGKGYKFDAGNEQA
ncbi:MAG TPA: response regulator transcription factor [Candidatus Pullilachnospira intestinigallinarum]|nr:response regulator transcription factor [Candidatus Pullilachnospira intestinigallinarum]